MLKILIIIFFVNKMKKFAIIFNSTLFIDYLLCLGLHSALLGMFNSARQIYAFCPEGINYVQKNYFGQRFLVRFLH